MPIFELNIEIVAFCCDALQLGGKPIELSRRKRRWMKTAPDFVHRVDRIFLLKLHQNIEGRRLVPNIQYKEDRRGNSSKFLAKNWVFKGFRGLWTNISSF